MAPQPQRAKVIDRPEIGLTEYWIVNIPQYCGKILVQKAGTTCPAHSHKKKHETFLVWKGRVRMVVDGEPVDMAPGDVLVMEQGRVHEFTALDEDAVIFEFSGQHFEDDSYFVDDEMYEKAIRGAREMTPPTWPFP
ncbi:MAG: cupin domain-containing protein [Planctomycetes bacterium]|nr:cupin domain-containing protein [Planctomycetota bacterium]